MIPKKFHAKQIFEILSQSNKNPLIELNYSTPFELLIAVILSAQSTDKRVNIVTAELFKLGNTPEFIVNLGIELIPIIKTIGLYNNKAKNILATAKILLEEYNSEVPDTLDKLESLPGVGRKTANVILNTIYQQPVIAVDTHVFRVSNRTGLVNAKNTLETENQLNDIIPKPHLLNAHHLLVLHGRYICTAKKPKCNDCLIKQLCSFYETNYNNSI